jgi:hypothetical protein
MATVNGLTSALAKGVAQTVWTITGTNDGAPESAPQYPLKSVTVTGTFGGGTLLIEESNDAVNYVTAVNNIGTAASFTAIGSMVIASNARYHRPRASVGVTSVVVSLTEASPQ